MNNTNNVPPADPGKRPVQSTLNSTLEKSGLWKSEQGYRALAANLPGAAVFIVDHDLRYLLADGESLYKLGFQPSDFEGRTLLEAVGPVQAAIYEPRFRQALAGDSFSHDLDMYGRFFQTRGVPLRDENDQIFAALAVSYDITERRKTEEALRQSEQEARRAHTRSTRILESISDAFYALDAQFCFTYINRKAEEWWGRNRQALIGRHYWTEFPAAIGSESYHRHYEAVATREPVHFETPSSLFHRWIDVTIYPTGDGGLAVYFRDISERKQAEDALRQMNEHLEQKVMSRTQALLESTDELARMNEMRKDLLQRLVLAQEDERRRISRELHDQTGQHLTGLALGLKAVEEAIGDCCPGETWAEDMLLPLRTTAEELARDLHRIAVDLRPTALDDLGLVPALETYIERWSATNGIPVDLDIFGTGGVEHEVQILNAPEAPKRPFLERLPDLAETAVYRICWKR